METKEEKKLIKKKEFYNYLKDIGLEPKMDSELQREKDERVARENIQNMLKNYEKVKEKKKISEQKVLKAEKTNNSVKKEEFNRKEIIINHLKKTFG